jgi:sarcosine oxidase subunit gamma
VEVSDARAVFDVIGPHVREVLAKLAPVDLAPGVFEPGEMRRTRLAQVAAAFWMTGPDSFRVIAFQSVAQYVEDLLKTAAKPGTQVGYFTPAP